VPAREWNEMLAALLAHGDLDELRRVTAPSSAPDSSKLSPRSPIDRTSAALMSRPSD